MATSYYATFSYRTRTLTVTELNGHQPGNDIGTLPCGDVRDGADVAEILGFRLTGGWEQHGNEALIIGAVRV